jgi:two-component system chemotaxis sensor kinase CheA
MIRNAVDHGLEPAALRRAAGKPETGTLTLTAANRSGRILVELADDGGGIQRDKVLAIAVKKGLISPQMQPTDAEIDALLFDPGFSTASSVSQMSGRGVGLDVVRAALTALGGRISIQSTPGIGSKFTLSLPLTLAVMDGMLVRSGDQTLVIPLSAIVETASLQGAALQTASGGQTLIRLRGGFVPLCDLALLLGFAPARTAPMPKTVILLSDENDTRLAVIVDSVIDHKQVVMKSLRGNCGLIPGVAAATILGDGKVALILDPANLIDMAAGVKAECLGHSIELVR